MLIYVLSGGVTFAISDSFQWLECYLRLSESLVDLQVTYQPLFFF